MAWSRGGEVLWPGPGGGGRCCGLVLGERCCGLVPGGRCCGLVPGGREVLWPGPGGREVLWPGPGGREVLWPGARGKRWLTIGVAHLLPPPPPPRVEVTHACENITFARFATRAVITIRSGLSRPRKYESVLSNNVWGFSNPICDQRRCAASRTLLDGRIKVIRGFPKYGLIKFNLLDFI